MLVKSIFLADKVIRSTPVLRAVYDRTLDIVLGPEEQFDYKPTSTLR